jgi:hypothetical protein
MIIPKKSGSGQHVAPSPRSTLIPMTVTVLVLLGLTLWLTSFERRMHVTITKPAATDPPYTIRQGERLEVEGIVDDGGNIYQQPEKVKIKWFPKDRQATNDEDVQWQTDVRVDRATKRFRQRLWFFNIAHSGTISITVTWAQDHAERWYSLGYHPLSSNIVNVRVE